MEKKIVPTLINFKKFEIGAILVDPFGNKRKTRIALILAGLLFLGTGPLFAADAVKKENALKQIVSTEARGVVNFLTLPGEVVYTLKTEIKNHPKAWPATYVPRVFMNLAVRLISSINDFIVLPWYVAWSDAAPLTRHFELPDYVWQKE